MSIDVKDGELVVEAQPEPEKLLPVTVVTRMTYRQRYRKNGGIADCGGAFRLSTCVVTGRDPSCRRAYFMR